ncbi:MAG: NERD domain-containing protein [Flammeovirgaceae bacterium]|jgi:hypothetical protein|nr:NERD domain-containing protein [Flammeovirgaceae bacterium]
MKMVPNVLYDNVKSDAERKVFRLLKDIDIGHGWTAYHSLNVSEHAYKKWGEIDFVIVGPKGLFCLEVKGGGVECKDDIWRFTNRYNETQRKKEGPFEQVRSAHYSLIAMFRRDEIFDSLENKINTGWGVIFPDISWNQFSPEMPREIICDEQFTKNSQSFSKYIKQLFEYWLNKGKKLPALNPGDMILDKIDKYLKPNFQTSPSLRSRADSLYEDMVTHTKDQLNFIEGLEENERIICEGGAGTGKTLVAIHTARNELLNGKTVLLVAMADIFTAYLKIQLKPSPALKICMFSELEKSLNFFSENKFDVLIVDEGQDLMHIENLDTFDKVIKGGLENGRWRFFMDSNAQSGIIGSFDQVAFDILKNCNASIFKLKNNCRNTKQIVEEAQSTTGAHIGETVIKSDGPRVYYCKTDSQEHEAEMLIKRIESLRDEGINLEDMAILSTVSHNKSSISKLPVKWNRRIHIINNVNVISPPSSSILFSKISEFKGLEKKHIMLIDTDYFANDNLSRSLLYIAMTRANIGLWVAARPEFNEMYIAFQKENMR